MSHKSGAVIENDTPGRAFRPPLRKGLIIRIPSVKGHCIARSSSDTWKKRTGNWTRNTNGCMPPSNEKNRHPAAWW